MNAGTAVIIGTGGIGDILHALVAGSLYAEKVGYAPAIYVNSHPEILEFVNKCTYFTALPCPERQSILPDPENPLNLPKDFLDSLFSKHRDVWACFPDSLGYAPFSFPWFRYVRSYKEFLRYRVVLKYEKLKFEKPSIFINVTSVTPEKNWPLHKLQKLVSLFNQTNYNVVIARTSSWKGTPIPFMCQGKYFDLVDADIKSVVDKMAQCSYFVGIDSGLAHIAYHLGMPRIVLQQHFNMPFHQVRWHEDTTDDMPLGVEPEMIFNRAILNIREPLTTAIPAQSVISHNANVKDLLIKKFYA